MTMAGTPSPRDLAIVTSLYEKLLGTVTTPPPLPQPAATRTG